MNIVITCATALESAFIQNSINSNLLSKTKEVNVAFHISGVGMPASTYSFTKFFTQKKPGLIIQAGIAGALDEAINLASVVVVKDEYLGDIGVEENGVFTDVFDMLLSDKNQLPFINKKLGNPWLSTVNVLNLPEVTGVTVNEISTRKQRIEQLRGSYNAAIESMEGAALHYVALLEGVTFLQMRSISNIVGERDKSKWHIKPALQNLSIAVMDTIAYIAEHQTIFIKS